MCAVSNEFAHSGQQLYEAARLRKVAPHERLHEQQPGGLRGIERLRDLLRVARVGFSHRTCSRREGHQRHGVVKRIRRPM